MQLQIPMEQRDSTPLKHNSETANPNGTATQTRHFHETLRLCSETHHVFYLASHFDVLYNGIAAQSVTFSSHKKSPARASPNDMGQSATPRTVANGCGRSSQLRRTHLQPPDPQLINGNPSLRIRENCKRLQKATKLKTDIFYTLSKRALPLLQFVII